MQLLVTNGVVITDAIKFVSRNRNEAEDNTADTDILGHSEAHSFSTESTINAEIIRTVVLFYSTVKSAHDRDQKLARKVGMVIKYPV
jgi:hypothetical protein